MTSVSVIVVLYQGSGPSIMAREKSYPDMQVAGWTKDTTM